MKQSIKLKFILSYLVIAILTLVLLNTYGHSTLYNKLVEYEKANLYEEAEIIVKDYVTSISLLETDNVTLRQHFSSLEILTNMRVWIVSSSGTILMDSNLFRPREGENINDYDSSFLSYQSIVGKYPEGLAKESMISVIYPITESLSTSGYVVLMSPASSLKSNATNYIDSILICGLVILFINGILFLHLYFQTVRPLAALTKETREYAKGHFNYPMAKMFVKEQKELANAIRYLSVQLSGMMEYQKNFIANVSHDFRSPLTSIKGYTEAMADGTIPPEMQKKYFNIILFETERLTKLTSNLLELNQLDHKNMVLEKTDFDINEAIKQTSASFEQRCTSKRISLDLIFEEKELFVHGDINRIQQVIQNLLDNAIKFSPNDTVITIQTTQQNHKVFVSVKDNGIGIPKNSIPKIWNRFYKTDLSRGKDKTGTGLGLSITKEIINAHKENINVISTEGVGTEFLFSLPKAR
ncbi:sensor histidine kinase [bacterium D16-51]|nr:sensor histidine kinase [bacterium D16-59]RKI56178.1 sensor histidine kinase [bacterium D16-51]